MATLEDRARALEAQGVFLGGPLRKFEAVGRDTLAVLRRHGLQPTSTVLDVGCGCLRIGYWLIHYLEPDRYCGIEPNVAMLEAGIRGLFEPGVIEAKRPRLDHNNRFDFSPFGARFDFVVARSIWTHASRQQIETMLDHFVAHCAATATFLASVKLSPFYRAPYTGSAWVGANEQTREGGTIEHSLRWIRGAASARGLRVQQLEREHGQTWLALSRR